MDKIVLNARERPYSPDITSLQDIAGRAFSEFMRYRYSEGFNANDSQNFQNVCYGLAVTSSPGTTTTEVVMTLGVLMQFSNTLLPAPGTFDSGYRVGINRSFVHVPLPATGSAKWFTLEAQVTEVIAASEQRDIMNATTGVFESQLVPKRKEWGCGHTVDTGGLKWREGSATSIVAPTGGDWVTLAAFLVQPGSTILTAADAVDLRPTAKLRTSETRQGWSRSARVPVLRTVSTPTVPTSFLARLAVEKATSNADASTDVGGGIDLSVSDDTSFLNSFDPTAPAVIEPATATVASTWHYLYLCPFFNVAPEQQRQGPAHTRGVLVLSANPPDADGLFNSVAVVLPAPFNNYTVPAYQAPCVGALRSNPTNNGWIPMSGGNGEYRLAYNGNANGLTSTVAGAGALAIAQTMVPKHARTLRWSVFPTKTGGPGAGSMTLAIGDSGLTAFAGWDLAQWSLQTGYANTDEKIMHVPREHSAFMYVEAAGGSPVYVATAGTVSLVGYST